MAMTGCSLGLGRSLGLLRLLGMQPGLDSGLVELESLDGRRRVLMCRAGRGQALEGVRGTRDADLVVWKGDSESVDMPLQGTRADGGPVVRRGC